MARSTTKVPVQKIISPSTARNLRLFVLYGFIFVAVLWVVGSQLDSLSGSFKAFRAARPDYLGVGVLLVAAGYIAAAGSYVLLAAPRLKFGPTVLVQTASGFTNRLLPVGLGNLGLFVAYMHRQGETVAAAAGIAAANNALGIVSSILLAGAIFILRPHYITNINFSSIKPVIVLVLVFIAIIGLISFMIRRSAARASQGALNRNVRGTLVMLSSTLRPGRHMFGALACNIVLTCLNATILCLCTLSVGTSVEWPIAVICLSIGTAIGAAAPTPGGLGGFETGLLAGLTVYGVPPGLGLASVLLYRLLTYWLPIIPGIPVFRYIEKQYL